MAYAVTEEFKRYEGISTTDDDTLIARLLAMAQEGVDDYCRRTFEADSDTTRNFDAIADVDGDVLYLDEDLVQITTVTNGDGATVASSQYVTEPRNRTPFYALRLKTNATISWTYNDDPEDAIGIAGRWAYSISVPPVINQATIRLATYLYRQKDSAGDLDRPMLMSNSATLLPATLPKDLRQLLNPYRKLIEA